MEPADFKAVSDALANLASAQVVAALLLAGTLTMAVIQIFKDMTPIRRVFQHNWMTWWLGKQAVLFNAQNPPNAGAADTELIGLATGGDEHAFYDLSADQLVAQMNAAAQITLDYPQRYQGLLKILAAGALPADINLVCSVASPRGAVAGGALPADYTDARSRVGHRIQRNLDGLQISMSDRWQLWLQWASLVVSTLLIELAVLTQSPTKGSLVLGLLVGIIGGYIAPVARDIVAAVQSLRNP